MNFIIFCLELIVIINMSKEFFNYFYLYKFLIV